MGYTNKEKQREYMRLWVQSRRQEYFEGKSCAVCDSVERLELDHIDPEKKVSHRVWSWSQERREEELAKCQVLCRKCHQEKTIKWWHSRRKHGRRMYDIGCRCEICRESKRKSNALRSV